MWEEQTLFLYIFATLKRRRVKYVYLHIFIVDFICIIQVSLFEVKYKNQVCVRGEPSKDIVALRVREWETIMHNTDIHLSSFSLIKLFRFYIYMS